MNGMSLYGNRDTTTWLGNDSNTYGGKMNDKKIWALLYRFKNEAIEDANREMYRQLDYMRANIINSNHELLQKINTLESELEEIKKNKIN